jgi:hypothetical protein
MIFDRCLAVQTDIEELLNAEVEFVGMWDNILHYLSMLQMNGAVATRRTIRYGSIEDG